MLSCFAVVLLAATCGHAGRPCPPERPFAQRPPAPAPSDQVTASAVAATGAHYEICATPNIYLVTRDGDRELDEPELRQVQNGLYADLPGRESAGLGGVRCAPSAKPALGVQLDVDDTGATPVEIARRLARLTPTGVAARVQVTIRSPPGPRCAAGDPACGPLPYDAACLAKTDYDPRGTRRIVRTGGGERARCAHDGECVISGCGNECVATSEILRGGTCQGYDWPDVYCGCVQNSCNWFRTD
jgi:hypothetical protein